MPATKRSNRKEQILQALAQMLETSPGQRITTAKLAAEVGVSEAALYRHFPSKARMFEGLIEFIEQSILSRVNIITTEEKNTLLADAREAIENSLYRMKTGKNRTGKGSRVENQLLEYLNNSVGLV